MPIAALLGAAGLLARDAHGALLVPIYLAAALELIPFVYWCRMRCGRSEVPAIPGGLAPSTERRWLLLMVAAAIVLALWTGQPWLAVHACGVYALARMAAEWLVDTYAELDRCCESASPSVKPLLRRWLALLLIGGAVLALPMSTRPGLPDYQYNMATHVLTSTFDAASACCLVGAFAYSLGEDHSRFGQVVIWLLTMLSGAGFCAAGLAIMRPFMTRRPRLGHVLLIAIGLQLAGALLMFGRWDRRDADGLVERSWWSIVHATSALWNSSLTLRNDGLAEYFQDPVIFSVIATLCVIGSLGLPVTLELILGPPKPAAAPSVPRSANASHGYKTAGSQANDAAGPPHPAVARKMTTPPADPPPWRRLAYWEAPLAVALMCLCVPMLYVFEHPQSRIARFSPPRPFELHGSVVMRELSNSERWRMSVLLSTTLRSAGLQSIPLVSGAITWPTYGLFGGCMVVGGSAASTAGGVRTTAILVLVFCLVVRSGWSVHSGGPAIRLMLLRRTALFVALWAVFNLLAFVALAASTSATAYETAFDAIASLNSVGLSTGLPPHLTPAGRITMMAILILGRAAPTWFWLDLSRRVHSLAVPSASPPRAVPLT